MDHFPFCSRELDLGFTKLKNRIIMGSMHTGLEEKKNGYSRMAEYYRQRALGGVALIVTGGISPNIAGWGYPFAAMLAYRWQRNKHRLITDAVHTAGSKIVMQILHTGRYGYHPFCVAPSAIKAPINKFTPWALSRKGIKRTVKHFVRASLLAKQSGYDGVEIMGSEGYLINQFIAKHTNKRTDEYGGCYQNRIRFPLEIVKEIREAVGEDFIIIFRLSLLDLVPGGSSWEEIVILAKALETAGVTIINTGIGWHEARIPTIATMVPRAAFTEISKKLKPELTIPLITSNRINDLNVAEQVLAEQQADLISMARPFLADPEIVNKSFAGDSKFVNTCIACNQACLDHVFVGKVSSCLVNPRACHETMYKQKKVEQAKTIAIVGAGPAGLSCALELSNRGHIVTLFDKSHELGGQFNIAKQIPGKQEFAHTIKYFENKLIANKVEFKLNTVATKQALINFDEVVIATGIIPRIPKIKGIEQPIVKTYLDVIYNKAHIGKNVAILGAGGIGFDTAEYLLGSDTQDPQDFYQSWGIDLSGDFSGGIRPPRHNEPKRNIYLFQRKASKVGKGLGKTTGWIHRTSLKNHNVKMLSGITYKEITSDSLVYIENEQEIELNVDHIVICTGQEANNSLYDEFSEQEKANVHIIGGSRLAMELDAKAAIKEGMELGLSL